MTKRERITRYNVLFSFFKHVILHINALFKVKFVSLFLNSMNITRFNALFSCLKMKKNSAVGSYRKFENSKIQGFEI